MAAVLTFWWMPDEESDFLRLLAGQDVVAYPVGATESAILRPIDVDDMIRAHNPKDLWLTLPAFVKSVRVDFQKLSPPHRSGYAVSGMHSTVIGYQRGRFLDDKRLSSSNLHAYWSYPDDAATTMIQKPEAFCKWARKVFAWVRRRTPDWHEYRRYRVSSTVKSAIAAGQRRIVP